MPCSRIYKLGKNRTNESGGKKNQNERQCRKKGIAAELITASRFRLSVIIHASSNKAKCAV